MSAPEVQWTLAQLAPVVDDVAAAYDASVERIDRDESEILEDDVRQLGSELRQACYVGVTLADVASDPIGTEFDHDREAVVGLRAIGMDHAKRGHVDSDGAKGVPWHDGSDGLVDRVRDALLTERTFPDAGGPDVSYTHFTFQNEVDRSDNFGDFYEWSVDLVFDGFEDV